MADVIEEQQTQVEATENTEQQPETKEEPSASPFSEEQLKAIEKMVQSETDRVRTQYNKKLKETQQLLEQQKTQHMTDAEKAEYERAKWEEEKAAWEAEKERQQLEIKRTANKHHAARLTAAKSIPAELSDQFEALILDDETTNIDAKADTILKLAEALAAQKVEQSLGGRKVTHQTVATTQSQKDFAKMSYKERVKLMEQDPALYEALKNKK